MRLGLTVRAGVVETVLARTPAGRARLSRSSAEPGTDVACLARASATRRPIIVVGARLAQQVRQRRYSPREMRCRAAAISGQASAPIIGLHQETAGLKQPRRVGDHRERQLGALGDVEQGISAIGQIEDP